MPGGGNSHQRKVGKKREETLTARVAEQVLQKLERSAAAAPTLPYEHPRSSLRDKLWNLLGSPIIWGAITLLLAAIGSRISSPTLFGLAFLLGVAAILKEDFFFRIPRVPSSLPQLCGISARHRSLDHA